MEENNGGVSQTALKGTAKNEAKRKGFTRLKRVLRTIAHKLTLAVAEAKTRQREAKLSSQLIIEILKSALDLASVVLLLAH